MSLALNRVTDWENKCLVNPYCHQNWLSFTLKVNGMYQNSMGWCFPLQRICYSEVSMLMLCQKPVRSDIQHFIAASAMAALTLDLIMICILQNYLNTKSLKGVLIPPECSLNWKVQEKTWSLIRSDLKKKKKKRRLEFENFGRFNCGKFRCVIWLCILKLVV